ncbi:MAG: NUDIX domain-containing protein [Candidatus Woesearchaeota archaeon]
MKDKLANPKRSNIFKQFLYKTELRFNEIEKATGIRSNDLAYFIQKLMDDGVLVKKDDLYSLSPQAEKYIPFFVESEDKQSPLPVVLVACVKDGKVILWKRSKRPYAGKWSLTGGRIRMGETVEQASLRVVKSLTFIDSRLESTNAVVSERNIESGEVKHAFIMLFTKVAPLNEIKEKDDIKWFALDNLPDDMIPSDRWLVQNKLDSRIEICEESISSEGDSFDMELKD